MSEVTSGRSSPPSSSFYSSLRDVSLFLSLTYSCTTRCILVISISRSGILSLSSPSVWSVSRLLRPRRTFFAIPLLRFASTPSLFLVVITSLLLVISLRAIRSLGAAVDPLYGPRSGARKRADAHFLAVNGCSELR